MPIAHAMDVKKRHNFGALMSALYASVVLLYCGVGALGYLAFGPYVDVVILESLPESWLSDVAKMGFCLGLIFTYPILLSVVPLQLEPLIMGLAADGDEDAGGPGVGGCVHWSSCREEVSAAWGRLWSSNPWRRIEDNASQEMQHYDSHPSASSRGRGASQELERKQQQLAYRELLLRRLFRTFLVMLTVFLGVFCAGPTLGHFVELTGCLFSCPLMVLFPALLHLRICGAHVSARQRAVDRFLIILGAGLVVLATYETVSTWGEAA